MINGHQTPRMSPISPTCLLVATMDPTSPPSATSTSGAPKRRVRRLGTLMPSQPPPAAVPAGDDSDGSAPRPSKRARRSAPGASRPSLNAPAAAASTAGTTASGQHALAAAAAEPARAAAAVSVDEHQNRTHHGVAADHGGEGVAATQSHTPSRRDPATNPPASSSSASNSRESSPVAPPPPPRPARLPAARSRSSHVKLAASESNSTGVFSAVPIMVILEKGMTPTRTQILVKQCAQRGARIVDGIEDMTPAQGTVLVTALTKWEALVDAMPKWSKSDERWGKLQIVSLDWVQHAIQHNWLPSPGTFELFRSKMARFAPSTIRTPFKTVDPPPPSFIPKSNSSRNNKPSPSRPSERPAVDAKNDVKIDGKIDAKVDTKIFRAPKKPVSHEVIVLSDESDDEKPLPASSSAATTATATALVHGPGSAVAFGDHGSDHSDAAASDLNDETVHHMAAQLEARAQAAAAGGSGKTAVPPGMSARHCFTPSSSRPSNLNKHITDVLETLKTRHEHSTEETAEFRALQYRKAINALKRFPEKIVKVEQHKKKHLPGIGDKILAKIDQICKTGTCDAASTSAPEWEPIVAEFMKLHGVSPTTAKHWYHQGYRTVDDLRQDRLHLLNATQHTALKYWGDLNERIPRQEVGQVAKLVQVAAQLPFGLETSVFAMGSFRRGAADSGDIDIILSHPKPPKMAVSPLHTLVAQLKSQGLLIDDLMAGHVH
ncbi:hypothetical protein AMAG_20459 [Allomyces macrogynus ATCC 38327]|uniref:DNA polymerase lambda n=1 Tax=Allomyces macrogynus (strain ATCC 38327) TaxID=578462 RepID=A0A0L0TA86_ALLM3|nr:hypothetical protein AMAG_20459 [Allomyces macrogynus ATCC 38327]|eukprot:KNE71615.1 hypothetical protein AMAG_20459 [Allomyces macrogynus ATCC 38327]